MTLVPRGGAEEGKTRVMDDEGGPMRTWTSFSGPCGTGYNRRESTASAASERQPFWLLFGLPPKSNEAPHGAGMQKTEREAFARQRRCPAEIEKIFLYDDDLDIIQYITARAGLYVP